MAQIAMSSDVMKAANKSPDVLDGMMGLSDKDLERFWREAVPELTRAMRVALDGMQVKAEVRETLK